MQFWHLRISAVLKLCQYNPERPSCPDRTCCVQAWSTGPRSVSVSHVGDFRLALRVSVCDGACFPSVFMLELEGRFTVFFASQAEVGPQRKEPVSSLLPPPRVPPHSLFASLDA